MTAGDPRPRWREARRDWAKIIEEHRALADEADRQGNRKAAKASRLLVRVAWRRLKGLTKRRLPIVKV